MDCIEIRKLLTLYLDGEFSDSEKLEIENHLSHCKACTIALEEERELKQFISSIKLSDAPFELRSKIRNSITTETKNLFYGNIFRLSSGFAIIAIVIGATVFTMKTMESSDHVSNDLSKTSNKRALFKSTNSGPRSGVNMVRVADSKAIRPTAGNLSPNPRLYDASHGGIKEASARSGVRLHSRSTFKSRMNRKNLFRAIPGSEKAKLRKSILSPRMLENLVVEHVRQVPNEIKTHDPVKISRWYGKKTGFFTPPPHFASKDKSKIIAGRLSRFNGGDAVQLIYNVNGKKVTLFMFNEDMMTGITKIPNLATLNKTPSDDFIQKTPGGRTVALFAHKGTGYSIISHQNKTSMIQLIKSIIIK